MSEEGTEGKGKGIDCNRTHINQGAGEEVIYAMAEKKIEKKQNINKLFQDKMAVVKRWNLEWYLALNIARNELTKKQIVERCITLMNSA